MSLKPERLAKVIAAAGVCSRRDAEKLILKGNVRLNGHTVLTPATTVTPRDVIEVHGKPLQKPDRPRLWIYHKPAGLVTTHKDPQGRPTVFEKLPKDFPRVISVGRLDLNSEGLLLLTTSGALARYLEHPQNTFKRVYRARAYGDIDTTALKRIEEGITIEGIRYASCKIEVERQGNRNHWITITLTEGKNREVRKLLQHAGLEVNRLIRTQYGDFLLGKLNTGDIKEVEIGALRDKITLSKAEKADI